VKHVIWIFAGVLAIAAIAALILRQVKGDPHLRDLSILTAITLVSAMLSMIPLLLMRGRSAVAIFQAAFGGTVLHLLVMLGLGAAVQMMKWVDRGIFLFLLLAFYWFSLVFIVTAMARLFRSFIPASSPHLADQTSVKQS
jgi:hypothetical protein